MLTLPSPPRAIVGRELELARLRERIAAAFAGSGNVALLAGEPGIGKTRLLAEMEAHARAGGALVLRGGATDAAGMPPYLPFIEALGDYARAAQAETLHTLAGSDAGILATLLPAFDRRDSGPAVDQLPIEQSRLRLFEAVTGFLHALAARQPVFLLLDDLHWADHATLDLLVHVARRSQSAPLAIAGAFRESEIGGNPALGRALAELNRLRTLAVIPVPRLEAGAVAALATAGLGGAVPPQIEHELFRQSEGNPFFAEELLRAWLEGGSLIRQGERWLLKEPAVKARTIADAIQLRMLDLPPATVDLLRTAAIIGRAFPSDLLAASAGIDPEEAEELLLPALRLGIVRLQDDGGYLFSHDKIRECLYADVTPTRRKRLHGFVGHALEPEAGADPPSGEALAALAFHFGRSGDRKRGGAYALAAMRAALAGFALEEAIALGKTARELVPDKDDARGDLLLELAEALILSGRADDAITGFGEAANWWRAKDSARAASALRGQGNAYWRLEAIPEARAAFEAGLAFVNDAAPSVRARLLLDLGALVATSQLRSDEGIALASQAVALAAASGDRALEAAANRTLGNLHVRANRIERGLPMLERALALAEAIDDPVEAAECCACLLIAYYWLGNAARLEATARRQIAHAERARDLFQCRHVYCWLACARLVAGDPVAADECLAKQAEIVDRLGAPEPLAYLESVRGMLLLWRGDPVAAEPLIRHSNERYRELNPAALLWHQGRHAEVLYQLGRRDEAFAIRDEVERALDGSPPDSPIVPEALTTLVPLAIGERDQPRIASYRARLAPFGGRLANNLIDRILGQLTHEAGELERAEPLLLRAEEQARVNGIDNELAFTLRARAALILDRGGKTAQTDARRLLDEADELLARIRIPGASPPGQPPTADALPDGLSPREGEVLRLLAAGKSNREIAGALFISEKTVANHLTSIFAKTGTDNRVAAATYALRHNVTPPP